MQNYQRDYYNSLERIQNLSQELLEWKALVMILAEGKDLLQRELDNIERDKDDYSD